MTKLRPHWSDSILQTAREVKARNQQKGTSNEKDAQ